MTGRTRRFAPLGVALALAISNMAALPAGAAVRAAVADPTPKEYVVGIGDSFMSGEGVIFTNHNFKDAAPNFSALTGAPGSNWQTAPGDLRGSSGAALTASNNRWRSVFGDKNGYPETDGQERVPYCDRSFAAAMHIGEGYDSVNFACSGAVSSSVTNKKGNAKPGVDFAELPAPATLAAEETAGGAQACTEDPSKTCVPGQATMLQRFASANEVKVVAMSIGGNDFGFADIVLACVVDQSVNNKRCERAPSGTDTTVGGTIGLPAIQNLNTYYVGEENLTKVRNAVSTSVANVVTAMRNAGYADGSWKLVYQDPPLPIGRGVDTKYKDAGGLIGNERSNSGGCGFFNSTLDFMNDTMYPKLVEAMALGIKDSKATLNGTEVVHVITRDTFARHRLCGKDTIGATGYALDQGGKDVPWQDDNGKKTEWFTPISKVDGLSGNPYVASYAMHPNYWGQRALAGCISLAKDLKGSQALDCVQDDSDTLDEEGRPLMKAASVTPLWITATGKPRVSGATTLGSTLTADADGVFSPAAAYDITFQWLRDGTPIDGATAATYAVTSEDLGGAKLSVRVTAGLTGFDPAEATSDEIGPFSADFSAAAVTITGIAKVGSTLSAPTSGIFTPEPASTTFQWLANGNPIADATGADYVVQPSDAGKEIAVKLTATGAPFTTMVVESASVGPVALASNGVTGVPTISGTPKVGETLVADIAAVTFDQPVDRLSYEWMSNGTPIPGATDQEYTLTGDEFNAVITVRVVGHKEGFEDATSATSDPTAAVTGGAFQTTGTPTLSPATPVVGTPVSAVIDGAFSPWPNRPQFQWSVGGVAVTGATGRDYTPKAADAGKSIKVAVTAGNIGYDPTTVDSAAAVVAKGVTKVTSAAKVTGVAKVGNILTATAAFSPLGAPTYQWLANGVAIPGATAKTFKVTVAQVAKRISVKVMTTPAGYTTATSTSAATAVVPKAISKTTITVKLVGRTATVTGTVTATGVTAAQVTGSIRFKVGSTTVKTVTLTAGKATAKITLTKGTKKLSVQYLGSTRLTGSTSPTKTVTVK